MPTKLTSPLIGVALLTACERPDPPSQEELDACNDESMADTGFDWSCCEVWIQECEADRTRPQSECQWICNG